MPSHRGEFPDLDRTPGCQTRSTRRSDRMTALFLAVGGTILFTAATA
ncbi:hypothetical protein [Methanoculleus sp.]|nr:hypothetical protein [Methanoculleus sp.]